MNLSFLALAVLLSLASAQITTQVPGRIEAEHFTDSLDLSAANLGGADCGTTQTAPFVDLQTTNSGTCYVAYIQPSEYLVYESPVFSRTADYTIRLRVASPNTFPNTIEVQVGSITKTAVFRGSGGWRKWTDVYVNMGRITQGPQRIQISFVTGELNFNFFNVIRDRAFNIEWGFNGERTPQITKLLAQTEKAARFWEKIITADVPDGRSNVFSRDVDDLYIDISFPDIDGEGRILGSAGPREIRGGANGLPLSGIIQFDISDAESLLNRGQFDEVVRHEMGHVLGLGPLWLIRPNIIINTATLDPRYVLPLATAEYNSIFGNSETTTPAANTGGQGSRLAHWRESTFDNELMTPYLNFGGINPLSRVSVQGLKDLGYSVNIKKAEEYIPPSKKRAIRGRRKRRFKFECRFEMPEMIILNE